MRRDWWRFYDPKAVTSFGTEVISVDAAFKGAEDNDFVAITVWGKRGNDYYLRYCLNRHLDFPGTLAAIRTVRAVSERAGRAHRGQGERIGGHSGAASGNVLHPHSGPLGGKVARVNAVSPAIESERMCRRESRGSSGISWAVDGIFGWAHDDMVDSASQALRYLLRADGEERKETENEGCGLEDVFEVYQ